MARLCSCLGRPKAVLLLSTLLLLLLLGSFVPLVRSQDDNDGGISFLPATVSPTPHLSLSERKLLKTKDLALGALLSQYNLYSNTTQRKYKREVLGYLTPWNARGYNISLIMHAAGKIDFVAPVWFRIVKRKKSDETKKGSKKKQEVHVDGIQDINTSWLQAIQASPSLQEQQECSTDAFGVTTCSPRPVTASATGTASAHHHVTYVLPRVKLETELHEGDVATAAKLLSFLQEKYKFQGFTIEANLNNLEQTLQLLLVLKESYETFIVLVVPPVLVPEGEAGDHMRRALRLLAQNSDRLSVMTYDHQQGTGQPNAPISWMREITKSLSFEEDIRKKILIGLPYYGWTSKGDDVTAEKLVQWAARVYGPDGGKSKRKSGAARDSRDILVVWNGEAQEHLFVERAARLDPPDGPDDPPFVEVERCYYPTHAMLGKRMRLAEKERVAGVAIWELGQGFPSFVDLY